MISPEGEFNNKDFYLSVDPADDDFLVIEVYFISKASAMTEHV